MLRKWLKRLGYATGGLVGLLLVGYLGVHVVSSFRMARKYPITHETVAVPETAEGIERGRHLVAAVGHCGNCHAPDFGGGVMLDNLALGRLVAPNLTSGKGGLPANFSVEDWVRVLRHGLDAEGHPLRIMPSETFTFLSSDDLGAIIAFMRQLPAVDRDVGQISIGPLARVLFVAGVLPLLPAEKIDHVAASVGSPPVGPTVEYGRYLAQSAGCMACHGAQLQGGPSAAPGFPAAPRLAHLAELGFSEGDFVNALRTGTRPDGRQLREPMPWQALRNMTDVELAALWRYLNDVPSAPPTASL
jgi:mono/diheme cytochrome c family protein